MSSVYLSTENYPSLGRQFNQSPSRHTKGYGYVRTESGSDNTDLDSDGKGSDEEFRRRAKSCLQTEKAEEKPVKRKERKHSLFNGRNQHAHEDKVKHASMHNQKHNHNHNHGHGHGHGDNHHQQHVHEEKTKERKQSHGHFSAIDHVKRKLSHTFTRRNSTSTSPELMQRKAPLKSKSSSLVSTSPELMHRKVPLKSNSSSLVSSTPDQLRRYALLHNQNHDEPRGTEKSSFMHPLVMSRKRSSRKQFESASNPDIVSSTPYSDNGKIKDFNVYCLGTKQTGKTALAVRFLTGRYIHEYISVPVEKYTRVMKYGGERVNVNVHINDTEKMEEDIELGSNSGIMIVYSITDRYSFNEATSLLRHLKILSITDHIPVVLIATKIDLSRLRKITERNASDLANQYNCSQFDVSAAADDNVRECFHATFKQIEVRQYLKDHNNTVDDKNIIKAPKCSSRESFLYSTL